MGELRFRKHSAPNDDVDRVALAIFVAARCGYARQQDRIARDFSALRPKIRGTYRDMATAAISAVTAARAAA